MAPELRKNGDCVHLETSMPEGEEQCREILEFGAVVLSAKGLEEKDSFTTRIRPSVINSRNAAGTSSGALSFSEIADRVYELLHGRIWARHNICEFDNVRIEEAFASIGRSMPEAVGFIDTLPLLRKTFGQRAGNLKGHACCSIFQVDDACLVDQLSTLAAYFSLGKQEHRSLPDVRMNIKVLKRCATVLLLESNFPRLFQSSPQAPQKRRRSSYGGGDDFRLVLALEEALPQLEGGEGEAVDPKMQNEEQDVKRKLKFETGEDHNRFLQPHEVLLESVGAVYGGGPLVILFHGSDRLRVQADNSRVKFSVRDKYAFSETGKPTFTIVIIPSAELLAIVKHCEAAAKNKCALFGINATWQPAFFVTKDGHEAIRIRIGTNEGSSATYTTKLYRNSSIRSRFEKSYQPVT